MLRVAETFYSLQGEGPTMGVPAVFLRLAGCNLLCGGHGTIEDKALHDGATWRCDTIEVWSRGKKYTAADLLFHFEENYFITLLRDGAHLIVTGGEPLMQQDDIVEFIKALRYLIYVEVETNGTIVPSESLWPLVQQFNVSPKLSTSGMPRERRIVPDALRWFVANSDSYFKFVVSNSDDVLEVEELFIEFDIDSRRMFLMPSCSTREDLRARLPYLAEICKTKGWRLSSRLQLELWDQTVGV